MGYRFPLVCFTASFLIYCLMSRVIFYWQFPHDTSPFTWINLFPLGLICDLFQALLLTGIVYLVMKLNQKLGIVVGLIILTLNGLLILINQKIYMNIGIPLNYIIITSSIHGDFKPDFFLKFVNLSDFFFVIAPIAIFLCLTRIKYYYLISILSYFILSIFLIRFTGFISESRTFEINNGKKYFALAINPLQKLMHEFLMLPFYSQFRNSSILPGKKQMHEIALSDPLFIENKQSQALINLVPTKNIVIFVLESVSAKYAFSGMKQELYMPFLSWLSKRGIFFKNHYTTGNQSAMGGFGILTGLYCDTGMQHFEMRSDLKIPTLATYLNKRYQTYLQYPMNPEMFFSIGLVKNSFGEFVTLKDIPGKLLFNGLMVNEPNTFQFFVNKFAKMKSPFLAVYWSSAAHFPYAHYQTSLKITGHDTFDDYLTNLRLLDEQLKYFFQILTKRNLLKDTLLIIVGDHGEAFNKYGSFRHGNTLYEEEARVPLIFYQEGYQPKIVEQMTSNADILPTLLDILGIQFNPNTMQGLSFVRKNNVRKYIFISGEMFSTASINQNRRKMIINFFNNNCEVFNLRQDPEEKHSQACALDDQQHALMAFVNYQRRMLNHYQKTL